MKKYPVIIYICLILIIRFLSMHQGETKKSYPTQFRNIFRDPTAILMGIFAIIAFAAPITEAVIKEYSGYVTFQCIGGIMMLCGGIVAYNANREISENWSPVIDKSEDQQLVTAGVYQYVRHPLYFTGLLIHSGSNIYFNNTWAWITTLLVLIAILYRIPREEKALINKFGDAYLEYKKNSRALIPGIF